MKIKGIQQETQNLVQKLLKRNDIEITFQKGKCLKIILVGNSCTVTYDKKVEIFRAVGHINSMETSIDIEEKSNFDTLCAMLDMSRNALLKVSGVCKYLEYMALMGFDSLMLYNEDVYELEGCEYFGYMRGKYSEKEIREIDDYANALGIEVIPCIQTLGHLEQYLKWSEADPIKDTASVLLSGEEKTYKFIEKMIVTATKPLRSKRIHIGMDEAHDVGLGKYLNKNGYTRRFDILINHLNKVVDLTNSLGLQPMMWGDMFFRLASKHHGYYDLDAHIPLDIKEKLPSNVEVIYWDYYTVEGDFYDKFIDIHYELTDKVIFAGGVWSWRGILPDYYTTIATSMASLKSCREKGVKQIIATLWGDDGGENSYFTCLGGLQMYSEYCYSDTIPTLNCIKKRFSECCDSDFDLFLQMSKFCIPKEDNDEKIIDYVSKLSTNDILRGRHQFGRKYMWQDILNGVFDYYIMEDNPSEVYKNTCRKIDEIKVNDFWAKYKTLAFCTFDFLGLKTSIASRITKAYKSKNVDEIKILIEDIKILREKTKKLRIEHRNVWFSENKAFGFEVLDIRYGGVINRCDTAIYRLEEFSQNTNLIIEELEEKRLAYKRVAEDWKYRSFASNGII